MTITEPAARNPERPTRPKPEHSTRSKALRRARRRWHRVEVHLVERLVEESGLAKRTLDSGIVALVSRRAIPDRILSVRPPDDVGVCQVQAAWPSRTHRTDRYYEVAEAMQVVIDRALHRLRKGDVDGLFVAVTQAITALALEDQKVVEAERIAHGGTLPERRERSVSVRAVSGGLPSLGKRR